MSAPLTRDQQSIRNAARDLERALFAFVPKTTMHYAVEDARQALAALIREIDRGTVRTYDLQEEKQQP